MGGFDGGKNLRVAEQLILSRNRPIAMGFCPVLQPAAVGRLGDGLESAG